MPAAFRMLPSPTLPIRPHAPTTASAPEARRWPPASARPSGCSRPPLHGVLEPPVLRAVGGDRHLVVEVRVVLPGSFQQPENVGPHALERLPRHRADLKDHLALAARHPAVVRLVVVLLVDRVEGVGREPRQLRVRRESQPAPGRDRLPRPRPPPAEPPPPAPTHFFF